MGMPLHVNPGKNVRIQKALKSLSRARTGIQWRPVAPWKPGCVSNNAIRKANQKHDVLIPLPVEPIYSRVLDAEFGGSVGAGLRRAPSSGVEAVHGFDVALRCGAGGEVKPGYSTVAGTVDAGNGVGGGF